jgi:Homeodomain-like domain
MRGPKPAQIALTDAERTALEALVRRHSTPQQIALRAQMVLSAASGLNNTQVGRTLAVNVDTVRLWRDRWCALQGVSLDDLPVIARLADVPRPGAPSRITPEQVCQIVALACTPPSDAGRPISQWSGTDLADELIRRGIVDQISPRHALRLLKKGISSPTESGTG